MEKLFIAVGVVLAAYVVYLYLRILKRFGDKDKK
nr:hypothetical protein WNSECMFO_WNSECMFO_CDS_0009 [Microvirus sp.]